MPLLEAQASQDSSSAEGPAVEAAQSITLGNSRPNQQIKKESLAALL
jgi:hypothetical protein